MAWCAPGDRQPQGWSATFRQVTASTASSPWSWARRAHQERTPSWYSRAPTLSLLLLLLPVTSPSSWPTWKRQEKWQSIIPRRDKCMAFAGWLWSRGDKDYSCSLLSDSSPDLLSSVPWVEIWAPSKTKHNSHLLINSKPPQRSSRTFMKEKVWLVF